MEVLTIHPLARIKQLRQSRLQLQKHGAETPNPLPRITD